jgi:serine/threonine-protein kinase HipA
MRLAESVHAVWLHDQQVGTIYQRGDYTRFTLAEPYRMDPDRPVLGLVFEQDLSAAHTAALRLPPWFSNLLPEGRLREWIAEDRGVSPHREMELLAQVGHDLPGAIRVLPADARPEEFSWDVVEGTHEPSSAVETAEARPRWRFSLAGVALKFSMLAVDDRLTLRAFGEGGDWIVKLPDPQYPEVPRNEYAMMSLAAMSGIDVPEIRLIHRDELKGLPPSVWPGREEWAYAVRRFDRAGRRRRVHIEDLAQVRNIYPEAKYSGNYETVAALVYRGRDAEALREFARRLAFTILIANGDGHLKNWSLIYRDARTPTLSPAYDLVATAPYREHLTDQETLALKFGGSRRFRSVRLTTFTRLQHRLSAPTADLAGCVSELVDRVRVNWPRFANQLGDFPWLHNAITASIDENSRSLRD